MEPLTKHPGRIGPQSLRAASLLALSIAFLPACGGGGGGGGGSAVAGVEPPIGTILSSTAVTPGLGGLLTIDSEDSELDGFALDVPPQAVSQPMTLNVGPPDELPPTSPYGQEPVGGCYVVEPTGTTFAEPARLSLPLPTDHAEQELYVGRWHAPTSTWENLGGEVDGDFISVDVDHLSLYGVFYAGKSLVRVVNAAPSPPATSGIELTYISGPVPPPGLEQTAPFAGYRPLPEGGVQIDPGRSRLMMLLPGAYHFAVSYPHPQPGVANSIFFTIPELTEGADDGDVDQTITIDLNGAQSSELDTTDPSIVFPGAQSVPGTNQRPIVSLTADAPPGVPVSDRETGGPVTATTRIVDVGPIKVEQLDPLNGLFLEGTATDPEGDGPLQVSWTWTYATHPTHDFIASGASKERVFLPNPRREGEYVVYFTAYDQFGLFDEGRWHIVVEANTEPTIEVIPDDFIIDFGRLDEIREATDAINPVDPFVPSPLMLCSYVDTDLDGVQDTTFLKTLPIENNPMNPVQDPTGATCVFALVFDADGDPLTGGFTLPTPVFGRGTFYAALPVPPGPLVPGGITMGQLLRTKDQVRAYNEELLALANAGALPVDPVIFPGRPPGTQALPIIWEAPDDPDAPTNSTNDCSEFGPCTIAAGGTVNLLARVTDGFSKEQRDYGTVGFPDDDVTALCKITSVTPNPPDPAPFQGVTVTAKVFPKTAGQTVDFQITGTDGYFKAESPTTDEYGCATFYIPGGDEGVADAVIVECGESRVEVTYVF